MTLTSSSNYCLVSEFDIMQIDKRANEYIEAFKVPDAVYLSLDLYAELAKQFASTMRYSAGTSSQAVSPSITQVNLSAGTLTVRATKSLRNFCMVGTREDYDAFIEAGVDPIFWSDQERARVDREFEDIILSSEVEIK